MRQPAGESLRIQRCWAHKEVPAHISGARFPSPLQKRPRKRHFDQAHYGVNDKNPLMVNDQHGGTGKESVPTTERRGDRNGMIQAPRPHQPGCQAKLQLCCCSITEVRAYSQLRRPDTACFEHCSVKCARATTSSKDKLSFIGSFSMPKPTYNSRTVYNVLFNCAVREIARCEYSFSKRSTRPKQTEAPASRQISVGVTSKLVFSSCLALTIECG